MTHPRIPGRWSRLRLQWLRTRRPLLYERMLLEGTLRAHLLETERAARRQTQRTLRALAKSAPLPDRATDPLGWAQAMTALRLQAEEKTAATHIRI